MSGLALGAAGGAAGNIVASELTGGDSLALLREIRDQLTALAHFSAAQRERTLYPIGLGPGITQRLGQVRMEGLLISGAPGDTMVLMKSTSPILRFVMVTGDPIVLEFPILLDGDISVQDETVPGSTNWTATLFARQDTGSRLDKRIP